MIHWDDVINHTQNARVKHNSFCLSHTQNQKRNSHSNLSFKSNFRFKTLFKLQQFKFNYSLSRKNTRGNRTKPQQKHLRNRNEEEIQSPKQRKTYGQHNKKRPQSIGTQTDNGAERTNLGRGRSPIDDNRHGPPFQFSTDEPTSYYRLNLQQVFGESFLVEATIKDKHLQNIFRLLEKQHWEELKC